MAGKIWCARLFDGMTNAQKLTYDFRLLKPRPGENPEAAIRRDPDAVSAAPLDHQKESLKRRVANDLVAANLQLRICELPYGQIARYENISEDAARRKYRYLELNGPEGGDGIQVMLRDDEASVLVPLWHEGTRAEEVFRDVWRCLEVIGRAANYLCYDPQLGQLFELSSGEAAALAHYEKLVRESRVKLPAAAPAQKAEATAPQIRQLTVSPEREVVMVALRENGSLFGFADVSIEQTPANGAPSTRLACLKGWYVTPEFRGRGIGRQLRDSAKAWAAGLGVNGWTLPTPAESAKAELSH
jgi:GNAT superfamily N-acetyltransferase